MASGAEKLCHLYVNDPGSRFRPGAEGGGRAGGRRAHATGIPDPRRAAPRKGKRADAAAADRGRPAQCAAARPLRHHPDQPGRRVRAAVAHPGRAAGLHLRLPPPAAAGGPQGRAPDLGGAPDERRGRPGRDRAHPGAAAGRAAARRPGQPALRPGQRAELRDAPPPEGRARRDGPPARPEAQRLPRLRRLVGRERAWSGRRLDEARRPAFVGRGSRRAERRHGDRALRAAARARPPAARGGRRRPGAREARGGGRGPLGDGRAAAGDRPRAAHVTATSPRAVRRRSPTTGTSWSPRRLTRGSRSCGRCAARPQA